ncbi:hypothetical protein MPH_01967 [Macrophomina phaseolina MS6]|uniref:Uncharacterized protein n=1 Tax=Macrophomina phaseolina (strain MS6) TaxID=1126212 RepID=K2S141_MACPH|nr:hypothetical protein MPH_01967 [Macrophomina phaseolina MS6]
MLYSPFIPDKVLASSDCQQAGERQSQCSRRNNENITLRHAMYNGMEYTVPYVPFQTPEVISSNTGHNVENRSILRQNVAQSNLSTVQENSVGNAQGDGWGCELCPCDEADSRWNHGGVDKLLSSIKWHLNVCTRTCSQEDTKAVDPGRRGMFIHGEHGGTADDDKSSTIEKPW